MPPLRTECPPGTCICQREELLADPAADARVLLLTRHEEQRLVERLENLTSLADLRHLIGLIQKQLGVVITVQPGPNEVRTLRGILITIEPRPGLCRKTRKALPAAIRRALDAHNEIVFELLNENSLFG
ncbi:MAG: hypothetical protein GX049_06945 [Alcaligenaceae bacterium]|nr:hypothetical protein [Alcaligenaceae bacterium]